MLKSNNLSVLYSHLYYFIINISKYDSNLLVCIEELNVQENFLYYYIDHLHTTFYKILNINPVYFCV